PRAGGQPAAGAADREGAHFGSGPRPGYGFAPPQHPHHRAAGGGEGGLGDAPHDASAGPGVAAAVAGTMALWALSAWQPGRGIYEDRAFDRPPLVAGALVDARCDEADILEGSGSPRRPGG